MIKQKTVKNVSRKINLRKDDLVMIIAGKDKGKRGKIQRVLRKRNRVIVEGLNEVKKHAKPNQQQPQGGIINKAAPLHISNVMLVDPKSDKPTRVGRKVLKDADGNTSTVRVAKVSGAQLKN